MHWLPMGGIATLDSSDYKKNLVLQFAAKEQLGVQSLAQGLFDTNSEGAWDRTGNPLRTLCVLMTVYLPLSHCHPLSFVLFNTDIPAVCSLVLCV